MKLKIGKKVKIKSVNKLPITEEEYFWSSDKLVDFIPESMSKWCNKYLTIDYLIHNKIFRVNENDFTWHIEWVEKYSNLLLTEKDVEI